MGYSFMGLQLGTQTLSSPGAARTKASVVSDVWGSAVDVGILLLGP